MSTDTGIDPGDGQPLLQVEGLSVVFDAAGAPAVDGSSWALRAGQVTALVGESGSGKSVSAMAVLGLLPPSATVVGSIRYDGDELVGASPDEVRAVRGAVFSLVSQEPMSAWNPVLTIGDQVAEAVRAHARVARSAARERVLGLLREAGLADAERVARSYPHQLSGGQLQRALIAMALSQDPVAIVADEPTTALDVTVQADILDLLRRLRDTRGTAVLLITHDMGVVADLADDVVVMRDGRVVEHAPVRELFGAPREEYTRTLLDAVPHLGRQLDQAAEVREPAEAVGATGDHDDVVVLEDVDVVYPGGRRRAPVRAADGVSLRIAAGEVLGLVGESGSGKSTLGQVVSGLLAPDRGRVVVDGLELAGARRADLRAVRRRTGIVFQDPASTLNPRWSVGTCVAEPLRLHAQLGEEATRARVLELLAMVGLDAEHAARFPHELSGGQRQRVAIARAVALDPAVLVADEPTSALDVSVQARVLDVFAELQARLGFACLFVSHNLAVVERVSDRVAVMQGGRIVETGPTARVLGAPEEEYTRRLVGAAPVADPELQERRRRERAGV
ncbi:dipeptide ABC transporter ATP-binding protein [Krasilnikoviella flava]|uniref:Peptide/nickel transport system ATP-binding protein n=1 Tax=Krasilnikoviella flava TaxID=526729 RepID=A0A1T5LQQ6_9MICO|nr:ABC transporter ATP-binding protein [Krasilnikoviella flava]SKC78241.1 peptide/nickel transport system ATP-binding protein [Krasilnikoviella flava]